MYQDCGGIELLSFGFEANFELGATQQWNEVFKTGSTAFGIVVLKCILVVV